MGQIVSFKQKDNGNYVIEVRPTSLQKRVKTTQVAGTHGYEPLSGLYGEDPEGKPVPLLADISVRYPNNYNSNLSTGTYGHSGGGGGVVVPFRQ